MPASLGGSGDEKVQAVPEGPGEWLKDCFLGNLFSALSGRSMSVS